MYQILIMDSQRNNRQKVRHYLTSFDKDYKIIGEVTDTLQAKRIIDSKKPDLIIGDDTYTEPTALQLFTECRDEHPELHMILFTDNPQYSESKEALASGRLDFLTKPVRQNDVIASINAMGTRIDVAQAKAARAMDLRYNYQNSLSQFKERFLMNLIYGSLRQSSYIQEQLTYFNIAFEDRFTAAIIKIDDYRRYELAMEDEEKQFLIFRLANTADHHLGEDGLAFISRYDEVTLLFTQLGERADIIERCGLIHEVIHDEMSLRCTIGIGRTYERPSSIHLSYNQAVDAVLEHHYLGNDTVIHIDFVSGQNDLAYAYGPEQENMIIKHILSGQLEQGVKTLKKILTAVSTKKDYSSGFYGAFIHKTLCHLYRDGLAYNYALENHLKSIDGINFDEISTITSGPAAFEWLSQAFKAMTDYIVERKIDQDQVLLEHTLKYVQAYYTSRISLASAAQYLMTTPKHLEDILFKVYNKTFYDFCMMVRIENAKEMLIHSRQSTAEVALAVGFSSTEYFVAIFKQQTTMTPSEYRHQNRDTSDLPIRLEKPIQSNYFPRRFR